jgi:hypothetical protein
MIDELVWVSIDVRQPHDRQLVYARVQYGTPQKVTFFARPSARWEGASIVYEFAYFSEWAPLERGPAAGHARRASTLG